MPKVRFPAYLRREIVRTLTTCGDPQCQQVGRLLDQLPENPELSIDLRPDLYDRTANVLADYPDTAGIAKLFFGARSP
jgi:molybdopterin converting factor small subunit